MNILPENKHTVCMKKIAIILTSAVAVFAAFSSGCARGNDKPAESDKPYGLTEENVPDTDDTGDGLTEQEKSAPPRLLVRPREAHRYAGEASHNSDPDAELPAPDFRTPRKKRDRRRKPIPKPMPSAPENN